ncbi:MAG: nuclear transport factor 2 family protein [Alphaproteobacteria bacterium]|nr:nuclear transport factor 2 family protein [Alphaproteobacteria bacterium]
MSNNHIEAVQGIYACFGAGDVEGLLRFLDPAIEWEPDWGREPPRLYRPRRGHEGVAAFFSELAGFEFLRFEPMGFLAGGAMVAVPIAVTVRHRRTGREMRDIEVHLWTFGENGLVQRLRHVLDTRQFVWITGET